MSAFRNGAFYIFLSAVLLTPLPLGGNRPWAWLILSTLIGLLMVVDVATALARNEDQSTSRLKPLIFLWLSVGVWAGVQAMLWVPENIAHPLWFDVAAYTGSEVVARISREPDATLSSLMLFLTYGSVFWLSVRFCDSYERATFILKVLVLSQLIYAVYGLIVYFSGVEKILWLDKWAYQGGLTSTFVNRNTYATFAGLGVLASTAYLFVSIRKDMRGLSGKRELFRAFVETSMQRAWIPLLTLLLTATALLLTQSRGGFVSTFIALMLLLVGLMSVKLIPKQISVYIVIGVLSAAIFAFFLSGETVTLRLLNTNFDTSIRDEVFVQVASAIEVNPVLGAGYGTFEQTFLPYKVGSLATMNWDKVHNTYLELALELGVPAVILIAITHVILIGVFISGMVRRKRRREFAVIGLAAIMLVCLHSLVDFSVQIPGFAVFYALILGVAWTQSWSSAHQSVSGIYTTRPRLGG